MSQNNITPGYPSRLKIALSAFNTAMGGKPLVLSSSPVREPHKFTLARIARIAVCEDVTDPVRSKWRLMAMLPDKETYWVDDAIYSYGEIIDVLKDREIEAARQRGLTGNDGDVIATLKNNKLPAGNVIHFLNDSARSRSNQPTPD